MPAPFRFVHCADVHLDTPFRSRSGELRRRLTEAGRQAFEAVIGLCLEERVDALLIAGDLFDNDRLSLRLARPEDWWFHVRGQSGSHVVLQGPAGARPDREKLRAAAAVAAWHSKARAGGLVAVSCTQARFVSKPRGARPGTVQIRQETVLRVRPGLPAPPQPPS